MGLKEQFREFENRGIVRGWGFSVYEYWAKEIKYNEMVLALAGAVLDFLIPWFVIVTDKRILLRPTEKKLYRPPSPTFKEMVSKKYRKYPTYEELCIDIFYDEIEKDSIVKEGKFVFFIHKGRRYKLVDLESNNLKSILTERVHEKIDIDKDKLSEREIVSTSLMSHIDGIPFLGGKEVVFRLFEDKFVILDLEKRKSYKILLENIIDIKIKKETEISEKERNVIGRAIAGGILTGGLGAIVGGISGIPSKQIKEHHYFLSLDYRSKEDNMKSLLFIKKPDAPLKEVQNFLNRTVNQINKIKPFKEDEKGEIEL